MLSHARPLLARVKAAEADVAALAGGELGHVSVRTFQSFGARLLPAVLSRVPRAAARASRCRSRRRSPADELLGAVESGEVDVSFAGYPLPEGPFAVRELLDDPYVLVTRRATDVRGLGDLSGRRLLGIRGCQHTHDDRAADARQRRRAGVVGALRQQRDHPGARRVRRRSGDRARARDRRRPIPASTCYPLPELPARRLIAVWHRERTLSAAAREFVEAATEACA